MSEEWKAKFRGPTTADKFKYAAQDAHNTALLWDVLSGCWQYAQADRQWDRLTRLMFALFYIACWLELSR